jgi:hypothetical protein
MISCRDWRQWTKAGYTTMTRPGDKATIMRHSGTPNPKIFRVQKSDWKFLTLIFLGSGRHHPYWLFSKGPIYQCGVLLISVGAIERHFERKRPAVRKSQMGFFSCTKMTRLTGHLQPRSTWPTGVSNALNIHPILRFWPRRNATCSLYWKSNWMVDIFRPSRESLLPRRRGWTDKVLNFLSALQNLEQRAKECVELRGDHVK